MTVSKEFGAETSVGYETRAAFVRDSMCLCVWVWERWMQASENVNCTPGGGALLCSDLALNQNCSPQDKHFIACKQLCSCNNGFYLHVPKICLSVLLRWNLIKWCNLLKKKKICHHVLNLTTFQTSTVRLLSAVSSQIFMVFYYVILNLRD